MVMFRWKNLFQPGKGSLYFSIVKIPRAELGVLELLNY